MLTQLNKKSSWLQCISVAIHGPIISHGSNPHWKEWELFHMTGIAPVIGMYAVGVQSY